MDIEALKSFELPGTLEVVRDEGGLPLIRIKNAFAEAEILVYAGHVTGFKPLGGEELLWMSPSTPHETGKGIRGGIPVCFPWFGPHKTEKNFPVHGFVRYRMWSIMSTAILGDGRTRVVLSTSSDDSTRAYWAHDFCLSMTLTIGGSLECELRAENTGHDPFSYEDCLHTYFSVGDSTKAEITGLEGVGYIDRMRSDSRAVQRGGLILEGETVNAYIGDPARCAILDPILDRRITIEKSGSSATVVWNPWTATAAKNPEIGEGWKKFLCVETATCLDGRVTLLPGTSHATKVKYSMGEI